MAENTMEQECESLRQCENYIAENSIQSKFYVIKIEIIFKNY